MLYNGSMTRRTQQASETAFMTFDPDQLKQTMRRWASGVTIVTARAGDTQSGMTVSAFSSVTLDPPLILVCLNKSASVPALLQQTDSFAVSLLGAGQETISSRFAGMVELAEGESRFDGVPTFTAATGAPLIEGSLAWIDCKIHAIHEAGTHLIVIGRVIATGQNPAIDEPLLYFNRGYRHLSAAEAE